MAETQPAALFAGVGAALGIVEGELAEAPIRAGRIVVPGPSGRRGRPSYVWLRLTTASRLLIPLMGLVLPPAFAIQ